MQNLPTVSLKAEATSNPFKTKPTKPHKTKPKQAPNHKNQTQTKPKATKHNTPLSSPQEWQQTKQTEPKKSQTEKEQSAGSGLKLLLPTAEV